MEFCHGDICGIDLHIIVGGGDPPLISSRIDGLQLRCFLDCLILASQDVPRQFSHGFSTEYVFVENCVLIEITYDAISTTLPTRSKVTIGQ